MHYTKPPPEPVSERTPIIRGISINNVRCDRVGVYLSGLSEMPIEDIVVENVRIAIVSTLIHCLICC